MGAAFFREQIGGIIVRITMPLSPSEATSALAIQAAQRPRIPALELWVCTTGYLLLRINRYKRQKEIINHIKCRFIRINENGEEILNINYYG